jgi:hypothetical protein
MGVNQGRRTNPIGVNCRLDEVFAGYGFLFVFTWNLEEMEGIGSEF